MKLIFLEKAIIFFTIIVFSYYAFDAIKEWKQDLFNIF
jgi:hypothetical protein